MLENLKECKEKEKAEIDLNLIFISNLKSSFNLYKTKNNIILSKWI